jgi:hypothetical protein
VRVFRSRCLSDRNRSIRSDRYAGIPQTWVSDFSHVQPGVVYPADDFDLRVWGPNNSYASSTSWKKTTEHAVIDLPAGSSSYSYDVRFYSRSTNPNANVFLAMAWTVEDHP